MTLELTDEQKELLKYLLQRECSDEHGMCPFKGNYSVCKPGSGSEGICHKTRAWITNQMEGKQNA